MIENELPPQKKLPKVRLGIVGGDLRALAVDWPDWCDVTHFASNHGNRGILNRLESTLKSGKLDALIYLTRWNSTDTLQAVKKHATCPVRYWDRALNELKKAMEETVGDDVFAAAMKRQLRIEELELAERARSEVATLQAMRPLIALVPPQAPAVLTPPAPPPPPPTQPQPRAEPLSTDISKRSSWTTPEEDALLLALESCDGSGKKLVENYRTLVPTSERTSHALGAKLRHLFAEKRASFAPELLAAVARVDVIAKRAPQTEQSPRGRPGEWILAETAAEISGRSVGWVENHKQQGNIRSRRMPGYPWEYSTNDVIRLARAQDAGHRAFKAPAPPDKVVENQPAETAAPAPVVEIMPVPPPPPPLPLMPSPTPPVVATAPAPDELQALKMRIRYLLLGLAVGEKTQAEVLDAVSKLVGQ
jgi:hypothetical protein